MQENKQNPQENFPQGDESSLNCEKNSKNEAKTASESIQKTSKEPDDTRVFEESAQELSQDSNSESENTQNSENTEPCGQICDFSSLISSEFDAFSKKFPNISQDSLASNKMLEIFARGKENQGLLTIYSDFCSLVVQIEKATADKLCHQAELERASVGSLESIGTASEPFFSKEQVKRMSQREIRENLDAIRKSQAHW